MGIKNIPWAVTGNNNTLHTASLARNATNALARGQEGTVGLKVTATYSPSSSVVVQKGNALIDNKYENEEYQSYVGVLRSDTTVTVPNNQTGSYIKTDYIIMRIQDPEYDRDVVMNDNHKFTKLECVPQTQLSQLEHTPHVILAEITWQPYATTITQNMITDYRNTLDDSNTQRFPLTLINGWQALNPTKFQTPSFYKKNGIVHLEGMLTGGNKDWDPICVLPQGYRPAKNLVFSPVLRKPTFIPGYIEIQSDGQILSWAAKVDYTSLSGISFLAEQ